MAEITTVQKITQVVQLTAAIMIAYRAGMQLNRQIEESAKDAVIDAVNEHGEDDGMSDLARMVARVNKAAHAAFRASRERD